MLEWPEKVMLTFAIILVALSFGGAPGVVKFSKTQFKLFVVICYVVGFFWVVSLILCLWF